MIFFLKNTFFIFFLICLCFKSVIAEIPSTIVFKAGDNSYNVFRIPTIVLANNGDLLAFCEARQGGDANETDLVLKRSSDNGKTWGEIEIVQESDDFISYYFDENREITIGNPAPVVDHMDPNHPGRLWLPFTLENDRIFVIFSDDFGKSWSEKREITDDVKREEWGWYATGPVHSIQLEQEPYRGRLVIPSDHSIGEDGIDGGQYGAHTILSDDHGKTWRIGAQDDEYENGMHSNETTVVELNDGSLYFNTRNQKGEAAGTRGESWSHDGGENFNSHDIKWKNFRPIQGVFDLPVVQGALLRVADNLILFSGPDESGSSGKGRYDMRIRYSNDEAMTWHDGPLIHTGPAAYSDMVLLSDKSVGILFESGSPYQNNAYEHISFSVIKSEYLKSMKPKK